MNITHKHILDAAWVLALVIVVVIVAQSLLRHKRPDICYISAALFIPMTVDACVTMGILVFLLTLLPLLFGMIMAKWAMHKSHRVQMTVFVIILIVFISCLVAAINLT